MYNTQEIALRIKLMLRQQGKSLKELNSTVDISVNAISELAKGKQMSCITLAKIADYLGCSVDYLLGRDIRSNRIVDSYLNCSNNIREVVDKLLDL